jgi:hypothetical protein
MVSRWADGGTRFVWNWNSAMRDRAGEQFLSRPPSSSSPARATTHSCSTSAPSTHNTSSTEHAVCPTHPPPWPPHNTLTADTTLARPSASTARSVCHRSRTSISSIVHRRTGHFLRLHRLQTFILLRSNRIKAGMPGEAAKLLHPPSFSTQPTSNTPRPSQPVHITILRSLLKLQIIPPKSMTTAVMRIPACRFRLRLLQPPRPSAPLQLATSPHRRFKTGTSRYIPPLCKRNALAQLPPCPARPVMPARLMYVAPCFFRPLF